MADRYAVLERVDVHGDLDDGNCCAVRALGIGVRGDPSRRCPGRCPRGDPSGGPKLSRGLNAVAARRGEAKILVAEALTGELILGALSRGLSAVAARRGEAKFLVAGALTGEVVLGAG